MITISKLSTFCTSLLVDELEWKMSDNEKAISIKLHTDEDMKIFVKNVTEWTEKRLGYNECYEKAAINLFKGLLIHHGKSKVTKHIDYIAELYYHTYYTLKYKLWIGMLI